ncbi:WD40 repeat domain-containing protein [Rubinisphaera margarita]|uniref:WD40 repeat domain-containing protein n=1 Tax=Rubinisphaera margarita TaxID=2909586 RepID=UPI001EE90586|nr:WD40 repeat domain-containing protein [Rubinisphaera margarita]MCG6154643.1 hypothetical protein [Rubinisphaera margarita]
MQRITGFINQPGGFVFSPDNRYVAIIGEPTLIAGSRTRANRVGDFEWADSQTAVIVANTQTGETLLSIPSHSTRKPEVFFSPDSQSLVVVSRFDGAGLWNIAQRKQLLSWIPTQTTTADHFSDDGNRFAFSAQTVFTEDGSKTDEWATYVIEPATATGIQKIDFEQQGSRMYVADLSGDGLYVVMAGKSIFEVFSVNDGKSFGRRGANNPESIRFVPEAARLRIKYTSRNSKRVYETPFDTNISLRPDFTPAEILRNEHLCVIKDDDVVKMTDAMTGQLLYEVEVPQYDGSFRSRSIPPGSRYWTSTIVEDNVRTFVLRDLRCGDLLWTLEGVHATPVVSETSNWIAGLDANARIQLVNLKGDCQTPQLPFTRVTGFGFSPDDKYFAYGTIESDVLLVNFDEYTQAENAEEPTSELPKPEIVEVTPNPRAATLGTATIQTVTQLGETSFVQFRIAPHEAWTPDHDGHLRFRVPASDEMALEVRINDGKGRLSPTVVKQISIRPNEYLNWDLLASFDGKAKESTRVPITGPAQRAGSFYNIATEDPYMTVRFSPNGETMVAFGSKRGILRTWKFSEPPASGLIACEPKSSGVGGFSADGSIFCSGTNGNVIQLWDVKRGKVSFTDPVEATPPVNLSEIAVHPIENYVSAPIDSETIRSWDFDGALLEDLTLSEPMTGTFSLSWADNASCFICKDETAIKTFGPSGKLLTKIDSSKYSPYCLTTDGSILCAFNGREEAIELWDTQSGELKRSYPINDADCMDVSQNDEVLAVGLYESQILILDMTTGETLIRLPCFSDNLVDVCFSTDGSKLVSNCSSGKICLWGPKTTDEKDEEETTPAPDSTP